MQTKTIWRILSILVVLTLAWGLRANAVQKLSIDYDEDDYMRAGQEYAHLIRTSDWSGFLEANYRPEHPPLAKIVMGISFLSAPEEKLVADRPTTSEPNKYLPRPLVKAGRMTNAILGWLTVALLAFVNPLAGLALANHTFTIKYVSQIMLEALPSLTSFLMVLTYLQFKKNRKQSWLITSAVFLGLTAASKYLYCVIGIAILVDWLMDAKDREEVKPFFKQALLWGFLGVIIFFAANPFLWADPIQRLRESVFYHAGYSTGAEEVQRSNYPFWQQLNWLVFSPSIWHPNVFKFSPDFIISIFAVVGLGRLWKKERLYVLWLGITLLFLLVWPTKWPQYILTLTVPLSLAAAEGLTQTWQEIVAAFKSKRPIYNKKETRQAIPWLVPGLIAFAVLTLLPFLFQIAVSLTDFNSASIRDGFQGGIWREVSGGLTGEIEPANPEFPFRSKEVQYTGFSGYLPIFQYVVTGEGVFIFNIFWMVVSTGLQVILGFGLAILLNQRGVKLGKFWQALFILPWAIPEFIGGLMWLNIFVPEIGWLSLAAKKYGESFPLQFLIGWERTPSLWFLIFLIPAVWYGFPLIMLAVNAGLKTIPKEVFEAASIDGADSWQTLRHMTIPLLMPVLLPAIIIRGIYAFNQFYLFQALPFRDGTLANISYNVFNPSTGGGQFAISAIINILTVIILIGLVSLFNRRMQTREEFINA
ncbi:MAG: ABC transporter permease subunit [Anaerolineales bacterium]|nr:ABC transporter permease subunit [Anaerolineales bacterium]